MAEMIKIKVRDPKIKAFLLGIGQKTLIEGMGDNYWACGASFRSKKSTAKPNHRQKSTRKSLEKDQVQNDMPPLEGDGLS